MAILKTGIDLVEIERLSDLRPEIRQRFLERVFTPRELEQAGDSNASLAGRFAVKEAVAKLLGTGIGVLGWKQIEVEREPQGNPVLHLYGKAQAEAENCGEAEARAEGEEEARLQCRPHCRAAQSRSECG